MRDIDESAPATANGEVLQAPFPYFGAKSRVADLVWERFGCVPNYVEPFFGSGAMLLRRPAWTFPAGDSCDRETINDADGHVVNFWRAIKHDPVGTAAGADRIVHELDLHAVGDALFCRPCERWPMAPREFVEWLRADEMHYHAEIAGSWAWFLSNWIGGLPSVSGNSGHQNERGTHRRRPHVGDAGRGVSRQLPHLGDAGRGECARRRRVLVDWFQRLSNRLRNVRCCCGDWSRVCGPSVTWNNATPCAVFLDPPYSAEAGRDNQLYSTECGSVAHDVRAWCLEQTNIEGMRIALCGYEGEHDELEAAGWDVVAWKAKGGYGSMSDGAGRENAARERIWFSPQCLQPEARRYPLFDE